MGLYPTGRLTDDDAIELKKRLFSLQYNPSNGPDDAPQFDLGGETPLKRSLFNLRYNPQDPGMTADESIPEFDLGGHTPASQDKTPPVPGKPEPMTATRDTETEQPKHRGLFGKALTWLKGEPDTVGTQDQYGLTPPTEHHESGFSKILQYGLPVLTGIAGGVGALPGLLSGYVGQKAGEENEYLKKLQDYTKMRDTSILANQRNSELNLNAKKEADRLALEKEQLAETIRHNRESEDAKKTKQGNDQKKLTELQGYAGTLVDQIGKIKNDLDQIPSGPVGGRLANLYAKTGQPSYATNITSIMNRLNPVVDTYTKMTAGRANRTIIESMKKNIEDVMHSGTKEQRQAAVDALTDYLQSEYQNTAAAHGADIDTLPTFQDLAAGKSTRGGATSSDDQKAISWAQSNPNDPRAKRILQIHGVQ